MFWLVGYVMELCGPWTSFLFSQISTIVGRETLQMCTALFFVSSRSNDKELGSIDEAHEMMVWSLAWHPMGHILCSGSNDHTTYVALPKLSHRICGEINNNKTKLGSLVSGNFGRETDLVTKCEIDTT